MRVPLGTECSQMMTMSFTEKSFALDRVNIAIIRLSKPSLRQFHFLMAMLFA